MILKQSFLAKMEGASQNYGCVILIMTVEMTQMSPLICAGKILSVSCAIMCFIMSESLNDRAHLWEFVVTVVNIQVP